MEVYETHSYTRCWQQFLPFIYIITPVAPKSSSPTLPLSLSPTHTLSLSVDREREMAMSSSGGGNAPDAKVETISRLAQWRIESFGPSSYRRSDPFKLGFWNWSHSILFFYPIFRVYVFFGLFSIKLLKY